MRRRRRRGLARRRGSRRLTRPAPAPSLGPARRSRYSGPGTGGKGGLTKTRGLRHAAEGPLRPCSSVRVLEFCVPGPRVSWLRPGLWGRLPGLRARRLLGFLWELAALLVQGDDAQRVAAGLPFRGCLGSRCRATAESLIAPGRPTASRLLSGLRVPTPPPPRPAELTASSRRPHPAFPLHCLRAGLGAQHGLPSRYLGSPSAISCGAPPTRSVPLAQPARLGFSPDHAPLQHPWSLRSLPKPTRPSRSTPTYSPHLLCSPSSCHLISRSWCLWSENKGVVFLPIFKFSIAPGGSISKARLKLAPATASASQVGRAPASTVCSAHCPSGSPRTCRQSSSDFSSLCQDKSRLLLACEWCVL